MEIKFKNGSTIKTIDTDSGSITRGVRSNYITCPCYDLDNPDSEPIMVCIDIREPMNRFVPVEYFKR